MKLPLRRALFSRLPVALVAVSLLCGAIADVHAQWPGLPTDSSALADSAPVDSAFAPPGAGGVPAARGGPGTASALPPRPEALLNHGRVLLYRIPSTTLAQNDRSIRVCLPRSYGSPGGARRRYPVVYLLHGWPGGDGNWPGQGRAILTLDSLSESGRIPEAIAVMPNGSGIGLLGRSLYLNSFDGRSRMEDFIAREVVHWVDSVFRTLPDPQHRAVIGLSEGATAAVNLALKHPDVFGACGGHSGQYQIARDVGMGAVFGPEPGATRVRAENSPTLYLDRVADHLAGVRIYFDCGIHDGELEDNREFDRRLTRLGIPHTFHQFPGHHGWAYWRTHLRDSLIACLAGVS